eukprot:TRINITY_DN885_c0_g1_i2.p1 TRINITY_DN885_c0_g1~~TRINITY_DN885_c0_g1_i2.p1  ORF type:complete len:219 (-),score=60.24 TRINITY_DN885_c0_g1_i2:396-1052(-)
MIREREHFSQFITENFDDYINRKKKDGTYGNHVELQAVSEIYSAPVQIYAVDEKPMNIFQGSYSASTRPIRISYHYGLHYNSVRDPSLPLPVPPSLPRSLSREGLKKMLYESELNSITQLIVQRTLKESEDQETEKEIIEHTKKQTEAQELESDYLTLILKDSEKLDLEKQMMTQVLQTTEEQDLELMLVMQAEKDSELEQIQRVLEMSLLEASFSFK